MVGAVWVVLTHEGTIYKGNIAYIRQRIGVIGRFTTNILRKCRRNGQLKVEQLGESVACKTIKKFVVNKPEIKQEIDPLVRYCLSNLRWIRHSPQSASPYF